MDGTRDVTGCPGERTLGVDAGEAKADELNDDEGTGLALRRLVADLEESGEENDVGKEGVIGAEGRKVELLAGVEVMLSPGNAWDCRFSECIAACERSDSPEQRQNPHYLPSRRPMDLEKIPRADLEQYFDPLLELQSRLLRSSRSYRRLSRLWRSRRMKSVARYVGHLEDAGCVPAPPVYQGISPRLIVSLAVESISRHEAAKLIGVEY